MPCLSTPRSLTGPPAYVSAPSLPVIHGLTAADVAVLSKFYESFVERDTQYVWPSDLAKAMCEHGIDEHAVEDS
jgi:hypothetical protein